MFTRLTDIEGYSINAVDKQDLGQIETFYFDDRAWIVRYIVISTGSWLNSRRVLISPVEAGEPDTESRAVPIQLKMQEIQQAPETDRLEPVSRQHEEALAEHYDWTPYWSALAGDVRTGVEGAEIKRGKLKQERQEQGDPNLRDVDEVTGYNVRAHDAQLGHIEDFIVDTEHWIIRYVLVNTGTFLPGRSVIVSPHWIDWIDWPNREVQMDLTAEEIKNSPEYDPSEPIDRDYEIKLHEHYGRESYWK